MADQIVIFKKRITEDTDITTVISLVFKLFYQKQSVKITVREFPQEERELDVEEIHDITETMRKLYGRLRLGQDTTVTIEAPPEALKLIVESNYKLRPS